MLNSMRRTLTRLTSGFWMVYLAGLAALTPAIAWAQTAAPAPALKRAPPALVGRPLKLCRIEPAARTFLASGGVEQCRSL